MHSNKISALATAALAATLVAAPAFDNRPASAGEWGARPAEGSVCRETPPAFVWRPQKKARAYDLQYAQAADFAKAVTVTGLVRNVHRPAQPLAAGTWRWRVRAWPANGKAATGWSAPQTFTVAPDAAPCPLAPLDELLARIPAGHPRLFMRPETLAAYRAGLVTTYAEPWTRLKAICRKLLKHPPAVEEPLRQLAVNGGYEGSVVVQRVKELSGDMGFNVATGEYVDMIKAGILDPTKVTRSALQNAASVASMLLTTECLITDIKEEKEAPMPNPGMGGMGGMM